MLNNTLNTNEVKDAAGVEVELTRLSTVDRNTEFAKVGELPAYRHRLTIKHQETGAGMKARRRSLVRVDKTILSPVDNITPVVVSAYIVLDAPVGAMGTMAEASNVIAELGSFCFLTGADSTFLFNGTGNGSIALLNGSL